MYAEKNIYKLQKMEKVRNYRDFLKKKKGQESA